MKKIAAMFTLVFLLALATAHAQTSSPGCYTVTISATGRNLLYSNAGPQVVAFSASYYTTGAPTGVSVAIETANVAAGTATPFAKISALTDTTGAQFSIASGGERFWYSNTTTLSGGTNPTIVLTYCVRIITENASSSLISSSSVTGTGNMVLANTPTLITPVLGAATGTSIDLTGTLDVGVAGTTLGSVLFHNATSGTVTLSPGSGALGTVTQTLPNMGVASALLASTLTTNTIDAANSIWAESNNLVFEGATADTFELRITPADPAIDTSITIPAIASGAYTMGAVPVVYHDEVTGNATDRTFFIATQGWIVDNCSEVHSVAAGGVSTLQVVKDTGTQAPGVGTDLLTAAFDLNTVANTPVAKNSAAFVSLAARTLAVGDRLAVDYANLIQSSAGVVVSCVLIPN